MGQAALVGIVSPFADRSIRHQTTSPIAIDRAGVNSILKRRLDAVHRFEAFSEISAADCGVILSEAHEVHFQRNSTIFKEGSPASQVALLVSGCLKITQSGASGQEVILRLNGPGDMLGTVGNQADAKHCYTARVVQPATILLWDTDSFESVVKRFPVIRRNIANTLERHLNELEIRFREVSTEKVAARLGNLLVRLINQVGKRSEGYVEIALSRRDLAQLTGTTLFTVSRLLCQWETQGIVSARREVVLVHNVAALQDLSSEE
jgi:CRP/FNR family transcriptional regulator, nitrogen oxide reductase regulator